MVQLQGLRLPADGRLEQAENPQKQTVGEVEEVDLGSPTTLLTSSAVGVALSHRVAGSATAGLTAANKYQNSAQIGAQTTPVELSTNSSTSTYSPAKVKYLLQATIRLCLTVIAQYLQQRSDVAASTAATTPAIAVASGNVKTISGVSSGTSIQSHLTAGRALLVATAVECLANAAFAAGPVIFSAYLMEVLQLICVHIFLWLSFNYITILIIVEEVQILHMYSASSFLCLN